MELPIYKCMIDADVNSDLQVQYIALVDKPAIQRDFQAYSAQVMKFNVDAKKRIVSGPAMIADMLIYRNNKTMGEFYTMFDKDTISTIVKKFFKKGFGQNFNIMHDPKQTTSDITIFESFITDSVRGIKPPTGYEDIPDGSWFLSATVDNDTTWGKVESGELKGFSIEGIFDQEPVYQQKFTEEQLLMQIAALLDRIPD